MAKQPPRRERLVAFEVKDLHSDLPIKVKDLEVFYYPETSCNSGVSVVHIDGEFKFNIGGDINTICLKIAAIRKELFPRLKKIGVQLIGPDSLGDYPLKANLPASKFPTPKSIVALINKICLALKCKPLHESGVLRMWRSFIVFASIDGERKWIFEEEWEIYQAKQMTNL